jgi:hypothetical protein
MGRGLTDPFPDSDRRPPVRRARVPRAIVPIVMGEAERRLDQARARVSEVSAAIHAGGCGDWDALHTAQRKVLAAERDVARIAGDEYAVEIDFELRWDTGAPLPHMLANGRRTFLLFYLPNRDPDWDGTWVRVVDPAAPEPQPLGVVEFRRVHSVTLGGPNDEAVGGHPLSGKGLRPYAAHRVVNSRWIAEAERVNSVHPQHRGGWHERLNHYVFSFHDETFEYLAESFTTQRYVGSPRTVLSELVHRLLD